MKTVFILLAMLIVSASAANHDIDAMVNQSLLIAPNAVTVEGDIIPGVKMYTIHWDDEKRIDAYRFRSGSWSFNVSLKPNAYYQCSYTEDGAKGVLTEYTCERIIDILLGRE